MAGGGSLEGSAFTTQLRAHQSFIPIIRLLSGWALVLSRDIEVMLVGERLMLLYLEIILL